ncbi:DUF1036 domain-containing protein [Granulicella arctica]|uniref:DUF1036 domain-containing protein n=1 Tax=Granulicella arctica TaxID=940613 RepID=UPI0021E0F282|nr:DUF1036 domain-containing protein [Granulicella arctica]
MQARIYRFEIIRAMVNGVYVAHDTANDSGVTLYEWTPATADRDAAKLRLSEIQDQVHGEVFSADASLYLSVASPADAEDALKTLQLHNLFVGIESGRTSSQAPETDLDGPPIVIPKVAVAPPPLPSRPESSEVVRSSSRTIWVSVLVVIICSIIALLIGDSIGESSASAAASRTNSEASRQASQELSSAQSQNGELSGKLSTTQGELKRFEGVEILRMTNKTPSSVHVAVMYKDWAGVWVLAGWQTIAPNATAVVASSPNGIFYYSAFSGDSLVWEGKNDSEAYHLTKNGNFVYYPFLQTPQSDWELTKMVRVNGGDLDLTVSKL